MGIAGIWERGIKAEGFLRASFRGIAGGSIARLSGFQKRSHRVPDRHSDAADGFIQRVGETEVSDLANSIHDELKEVFKYKRKDLTLDLDVGSATITTPQFDVAIDIAQDPDNHEDYVQTVSVSSFREAGIVFDQRFQTVFSAHCDTLVVQFERKVSISKRIDQIQEDEMLAEHLSYGADLRSLALELPDNRLRLRMTASAMEDTVPRARDIGLLLNNYKKATEMLTGAGIRLLNQG